MKRRRVGIGVLLSALAGLVVFIGAGAAAADKNRIDTASPARLARLGVAPTGAAYVDPLLRQQLRRSKSGRVEAIVSTWNRSGLRTVRALGVRGTTLRRLPMILTDSLTARQFRLLRHSSAVRGIEANRRYRTTMEDTTWITKARYAWAAPGPPGPPPGQGVTGTGVDLAVIDTGADGQHEDMDNLVEFCETTAAVTSDHTSVLCSPFQGPTVNLGPACPADTARLCATDDDGHGSHVSGTIAGSGQASGGMGANHSTIGMAPNAKLHVYSANVGPTLQNHEILSAYDDMTNKKLLGLSRVVAVNNSWGGGTGSNYNPNSAQSMAFKAAYDAGILSAFAAGNSGPEHNTLSGQCISPWVVCVAASTKPDSIVAFSSKGRPSEPADTNRDGTVGGSGDIAPDNHDRKLGQLLNLGLYRPALGAPGVNINSISANSATCREGGVGTDSGCYEPLNGTSMATPHVTGAVGLIVDAYRQGHGGATPPPSIITDILERSANISKLPGWESEEQGAGRLNAYEAVKFAKAYPGGLPKANFGTPSPPYQAGLHPGSPGSQYMEKGCTGTASWSVGNTSTGPLPIEPPPGPGVLLPRYGQHVIDVPAKVERLRVTMRWPGHPTANLYARLWRPGVDPDAEFDPPGPSRVFPDAEAVGIPIGTPPTYRLIDVRAPEEATLEEGKWILRVYHRVGGTPAACDTTSQENPKQTEGFNYTLQVEMPRVTDAPTVTITSPLANSTASTFQPISGTAMYPNNPWEGVTNWEVPGSGNPATGPEPPDTRPILHFQGNLEEVGCTGVGNADVANACNGPYLNSNSTLSTFAAASWTVPNPIVDGTVPRNIHDPNWVWRPGVSTTISGPMTIEWWASCAACESTAIGLDADWTIQLFVDNNLVVSQRLTATPALAGIASKLTATVSVPTTTGTEFVLQIDPVYVDSQNNTKIYYDSTSPCPTATGTDPCDSIVRMPVGSGSGSGGPGNPTNVRVTDLANAPGPTLRIAWNAVSGGTAYEIHRSTNPAFVPTAATRIATTAGAACNSPDVPTWPTASRPGLCYTNNGTLTALTTYYYRVVAVGGTSKSKASLLAYGTPTRFDRQVKLKVDRLYGPQVWEYADLTSSDSTTWTFIWDTRELAPVARLVFARSFMQGIGSTKARLPLTSNGTTAVPDLLTLTPETATNEIGEQHCVTATVTAQGSPSAGVTVRFTVAGPGATTGTKVTSANGTATFCYTSSFAGTDTITAYADLDQDNVPDSNEPSDTAMKTWVLPQSSELCDVRVTNGGWIIAANGDRANFGGNATSDAVGNVSGNENYQDQGPAQPMHVKSIVVTTLLCSPDRTRARILGKASVDGSGSFDFRLDVADLGEPGSNDRYRIRIPAFVYDSGEQVLQGGNVQIH